MAGTIRKTRWKRTRHGYKTIEFFEYSKTTGLKPLDVEFSQWHASPYTDEASGELQIQIQLQGVKGIDPFRKLKGVKIDGLYHEIRGDRPEGHRSNCIFRVAAKVNEPTA